MNRRKFINSLAVGTTSLSVDPSILRWRKQEVKPIRIALIGKGGMGTADTNTALRVPGVELTAVCDVYKPRLQESLMQWGDHLRLETDYEKILDDPAIDAVIIATPDHWHQKIATDALKRGKHVYCEKPIIHHKREGEALIRAQRASGKVFQMGTQGVSAIGVQIAKILFEEEVIGKLNAVEAKFSAAPSGLKPFRAPAEATSENIWWDQFLGQADKIPFTPQKFFSWRNWSDYGTGLAGDLFVHVIAGVHHITGVTTPKRVYADGDILYYNDGSRDTPDVIFSLFDYETSGRDTHFKMSLSANIVDGISKNWGSSDFEFIGSGGAMQVNWDKVTLKLLHPTSIKTVEKRLAQLDGFSHVTMKSDTEFVFEADPSYPDAHYIHFKDFFDAIRDGTKNIASVEFGVDASTAALRSFESQMKRKSL